MRYPSEVFHVLGSTSLHFQVEKCFYSRQSLGTTQATVPKARDGACGFGEVEASFWVGAAVTGSSVPVSWLCSPPLRLETLQRADSSPFPSRQVVKCCPCFGVCTINLLELVTTRLQPSALSRGVWRPDRRESTRHRFMGAVVRPHASVLF